MKYSLSWRSLTTVLYWICAFALVKVMGHLMEQSEQKPFPGEPPKDVLAADFQEAASSLTGEAVSEKRTFHRGYATGVRQTFSLSRPLNISKTEIIRKMTERNWVLAQEEPNVGNTIYLKFCKRGVAAIFDGTDSFAQQRFHISAVWSADISHYGHCPH